MPFIKVTNATNLYYKDWGIGQPIVFVHGWCINSDSWEYLMQPLAEAGFRCIAYDQRGCGRSDQSWQGYDYSTLADDLASLIEQLDLKEAILVGHSMGCGVITQYLADHGDIRIKKAILIGTTTPYALKTEETPEGIDEMHLVEAIDFMRRDRPAYVRGLADGFFDLQTPGNASDDMVDWALAITLQASAKASVEMLTTSIKSDLRESMLKIDIPVLLLHGDKDVSCPAAISALPSHKLLHNSQLKIYEGMPHGAYINMPALLMPDILQFIKN